MKSKTVKEYLRDIKETGKEKPADIKDALDIYRDLWQKAIKSGIVNEEDEMDVALSKIDSRGGLYRIAEETG